MTPLHIRIRYRSSQNSLGECGLWFSASTKDQIRDALQTHRIDPQSIFQFEVDNGEGLRGETHREAFGGLTRGGMKMREIKFRGKRVDNAEWVYGFLFVDQNGAHYILNTNNDGDNGINCSFIIVEHETVGQYTDLRDKNGTEIYEKDVVLATPMLVETIPTFKSIVEWKQDCCRFVLNPIEKEKWRYFSLNGYGSLDDSLWLEVIGNVSEHPQLLESAAE